MTLDDIAEHRHIDLVAKDLSRYQRGETLRFQVPADLEAIHERTLRVQTLPPTHHSRLRGHDTVSVTKHFL